MFDPRTHEQLKVELTELIRADRWVLDQLRNDIRPLRAQTRRIQPRSATSISLVAADGGNNQLQFDPFLIQLIRVVDSSDNEYCLEVITPTTDIFGLSRHQFDTSGNPVTPLGEMMEFLGVSELPELSHMIRPDKAGHPKSPSWIQVYRELVEWAILFKLVRGKDFGTDTLIIRDGLLRSKVFARDLFARYKRGLDDAIERQFKQNHRRVYVAGVAKRSKVLARYRLAMSLEGVLRNNYPCYVEVPRVIEINAYVWSEYARGDDRGFENITEVNKFVAGKMFFVKFGNRPADPIWPVDILLSQTGEAQKILGYMLADALNGFPVPFYPRCLQKAHENAALVDFDLDVLQNQIFERIRDILGPEAQELDIFRLGEVDPASRRYRE
ncbi:MAG TPA: hypothetical protein GXX51_04990 [Firmicutes bacterium]|nr:hypothetical protein [Bacillota bacterium]